MKTVHVLAVVLATLALSNVVRAEEIRATLTGFQEVPAVVSPGHGQFRAHISHDEAAIDYELTFSDVVGPAVNGSIVVWLCQTAAAPAPAAVSAMTQQCPQSGTITGTITAAGVLASAASQQVAAGRLDEVITAIRAGVAYVNVHALPANPGGEIRGRIHASDRR
jgi:hypothetical protein